MEDLPKNERVRRLLEGLRAWCDEAHGRRVQAAKALRVTPSMVSDWLNARPGKLPTADQILILQEFLEEQRRKKGPSKRKNPPIPRRDRRV